MSFARAYAKTVPMISRWFLRTQRAVVVAKVIAECRPIADSEFLRPIPFLCTDCVFGIVNSCFPLIRLAHEIEPRCGRRVPYLPQLDLDSEKSHRAIGDPIEPVYGGAMLLADLRGNPDDCLGVQSRGVSQKLSEVLMVGLFNLVLDDYPAVFLRSVLTQQISSKRSDVLFLRLELEVDP